MSPLSLMPAQHCSEVSCPRVCCCHRSQHLWSQSHGLMAPWMPSHFGLATGHCHLLQNLGWAGLMHWIETYCEDHLPLGTSMDYSIQSCLNLGSFAKAIAIRAAAFHCRHHMRICTARKVAEWGSRDQATASSYTSYAWQHRTSAKWTQAGRTD